MNIHGKLIDIYGITFTGFSGSSKYKEGEFMLTQSESVEFSKTLPKADILFNHDCDYGAEVARFNKVSLCKNVFRYFKFKNL
ncbi:hypothetical protein FACS189499_10540 [Clostridia bacterium]|nr:hypothetical protein FACS189499_10540 [Clostridia bacterium]